MGKHYSDNSHGWIKISHIFDLQKSEAAKIAAIYEVDTVLYLVLRTYPGLHLDEHGMLVLPASTDSSLQIVALADLLVINGMWCVHVEDDCKKFVEMNY